MITISAKPVCHLCKSEAKELVSEKVSAAKEQDLIAVKNVPWYTSSHHEPPMKRRLLSGRSLTNTWRTFWAVGRPPEGHFQLLSTRRGTVAFP